VLVVCFNKTLVHYLRQRIEDRFGRLAWDKPSDESLTVSHFEAVVRELEVVAPALRCGLDFREKAKRAKAMSDAFDKLEPAAREPLLYDAVYVDEAQDLLPEEFELLLRLARKDAQGNQSFIVFYDNAQNIYGVPTPVWSKLGLNIVGRTVYLDQCLRNTRETLAFAFNVLVGSFAPEGQRVATRQFADVSSLKQRGLISENGDRYDIHFSPRTGPPPVVTTYPSRQAEIDGTAKAIQDLITQQKVLPNDILVVYKAHYAFKERLANRLSEVIGPEYALRLVDNDHRANKNLPLVEDGFLTVSTIASAKGYDAPIVFLLGADELATDAQGRASFYVGATRAKLCLHVSGVKLSTPSLLDEILLASQSMTRTRVVTPPIIAPKRTLAATVTPQPSGTKKPPVKTVCRHCGSELLHAQHGKFGYFYRCISCTDNTPIDTTCPSCGKAGKVRKAGLAFYFECEPCGISEVIHRNVPLESL
jgi:superfamily I DNA and RNA helicase